MPPPRKKERQSKNASEDGLVTITSPDGRETFVLFYGPTPFLSNFHPSPFRLGDNQFNCTEQFFHYKKAEHFMDQLSQRDILSTDSPGEQKKLGRAVRNYDNCEWQRVCERYMKDGLMAKFEQNEDLRHLLFKTAGKTLVEASPRDTKWGIGLGVHNPNAGDRANWRGKNILGKLLMEVRKELMAKPEYKLEADSCNQQDADHSESSSAVVSKTDSQPHLQDSASGVSK